MNTAAWKKTAVLTITSAVTLMSGFSMTSAGEHPHYMPPQISSYPSAKAPSSEQTSKPETDGKEETCRSAPCDTSHRTIFQKNLS